MIPTAQRRRKWRTLVIAGFAIAVAGCTTMDAPSSGASKTGTASAAAPAGPPPLVQNCGIVGISSPTKYACDGKVYTSFQLMKLREDWAKSHRG